MCDEGRKVGIGSGAGRGQSQQRNHLLCKKHLSNEYSINYIKIGIILMRATWPKGVSIQQIMSIWKSRSFYISTCVPLLSVCVCERPFVLSFCCRCAVVSRLKQQCSEIKINHVLAYIATILCGYVSVCTVHKAYQYNDDDVVDDDER